MHEMAIVTDIVDTICNKAVAEGAQRVVSVALRIGEGRDIHEDLLQRYFDVYSRGTIAEGVRVTTMYSPIVCVCSQCGRAFPFDMRSEEKARCKVHPESDIHVSSGFELIIEEIGVI